MGPENGDKMKKNDKSRKWMWWFLGAVAAMQMYFVRELFAAFALFVLVFAALGAVVVAIYMLHHGWAVAVEGLAASQHPAVRYTKHQVNSMEASVRRGLVSAAGGAEMLAKRAVRAGSVTVR
jgi:hypothetical protein